MLMKIPFDRVAHIYDKTRGLPPQVMRKVVKALVKELQGHKTILDVGVGTGRFAQPLQKRGLEVVGIDISRDMMKKAKEKGIKNLLLGDACYLPFRESSFDASLYVHILHLVSQWQTALKETCRVTKNELFTATHRHWRSPISIAYEELAKERGYDTRYVGLGEHELKEKVKPTRSIRAASWVSSANQHLTYLKQRAYSRQWKVPEDVDKQIVQELAGCFAGQRYSLDVQILRWNIKDLKSYLQKETNTSLT